MARSIADQFRAAIRKAEQRGLTRYAIAKAANVGQGNLSRYCTGEIVPKLDTAERVVKAIGGSIQIEFE